MGHFGQNSFINRALAFQEGLLAPLLDTEFGRAINLTPEKIDFVRKRLSIEWARGVPAKAWSNYVDWHREESGAALRKPGDPAFTFSRETPFPRQDAIDLLKSIGGQLEKLAPFAEKVVDVGQLEREFGEQGEGRFVLTDLFS